MIAYIISGITLKIADLLGERENTLWSYLSAIICAFFFPSSAIDDPIFLCCDGEGVTSKGVVFTRLY